MKTLFKRIFEEKVPGTDRTYLTDILAMRVEVERQLGNELNATQQETLATLRVDLLGVRTGHDPIGEYVKALLQ